MIAFHAVNNLLVLQSSLIDTICLIHNEKVPSRSDRIDDLRKALLYAGPEIHGLKGGSQIILFFSDPEIGYISLTDDAASLIASIESSPTPLYLWVTLRISTTVSIKENT